MAVKILKDKCVGCESCLAICPAGALFMESGKAEVKEDSCIACGACVSECPVGAISLPKVEREVANKEGRDLWVMAETDAGKIMGVTFELLGAAAKLAAKSGEKCAAVLLVKEAGELPQQLIAAGADKVYLVTGPEYAEYNTDIFTNAFCELAKAYKPSAVLYGATIIGRDLAPRIAARLRTGLCADCTSLDIQESGLVEWTRPALGGNIMATILCEEHRPQMGTVRPKIFKAAAVDETRKGEVIAYTVQHPVTSKVELVRNDPATGADAIKIEDAAIICSGGRGLGDVEHFRVLEQLAALFENAAVAGSRAVVDDKWIGHPCQVGQSGKTVTPKVYFAFGISGAIQHLAGMKESDVIIAINKDPNAPIFQVARYGIVGDANVILPKLIEKIKAFKQA
jgi:electron transfer flavoprotein alpha subunit